MDGQSAGVSLFEVTDGGTTCVVMEVSPFYGDSSLHAGSHEFDLYDDTSGRGGDGGGGGGGSGSGGGGVTKIIVDGEEPAIETPAFINASVFGPFHAFRKLPITNNREGKTFNITITPAEGEACRLIRFEDTPRGSEVTVLVRKPGQVSQSTSVRLDIRPPENRTRIMCRYEIRHAGQLLDEVTVNVRRGTGFFRQLVDFFAGLFWWIP